MVRLFLAAECSPLQNEVGGTWIPASCTAGPNGKGASCNLQCNNGYHLRGSSSVQCTDKGWKSVNGDFIPKCLGEYVSVESTLGFLLSGDENYSILSKFRPPAIN